MLPHLFLCRHGETAWNAERRIQGQTDIPLNDLGRRQAAGNGARLRELLGAGAPGWDFLASPLGRTRETMEILREALGLPREGYPTDPRLMELHFGDWQGFTLAEIAKETPGAIEERERDKWNYVPPGAGAESYAMLDKRIWPVFAELTRPTIVVAHGGVARCFLVRLDEMTTEEAAHSFIAQDRVIEAREGRVDWV